MPSALTLRIDYSPADLPSLAKKPSKTTRADACCRRPQYCMAWIGRPPPAYPICYAVWDAWSAR